MQSWATKMLQSYCNNCWLVHIYICSYLCFYYFDFSFLLRKNFTVYLRLASKSWHSCLVLSATRLTGLSTFPAPVHICVFKKPLVQQYVCVNACEGYQGKCIPDWGHAGGLKTVSVYVMKDCERPLSQNWSTSWNVQANDEHLSFPTHARGG